jgi:hypothetical protein
MSRSLRQIAYSLAVEKAGREPRLYRWLKRSRLGDVSFSLNVYDILLVVARKESQGS